jgi:hypothetical protein
MANDVYMDEVGFNLHLTHRFDRACQGQRCQQIHPTQRGQNLSLVVAIGREGVIACNVTFGASNMGKFLEFIQTKVIES